MESFITSSADRFYQSFVFACHIDSYYISTIIRHKTPTWKINLGMKTKQASAILRSENNIVNYEFILFVLFIYLPHSIHLRFDFWKPTKVGTNKVHFILRD